jgi:hypothetical protein
MQSLVLVPDELVKSAVFLEEIQVIEARYQEDIPYPASHQVLKALEPSPVSVLDPERIQILFGQVRITSFYEGSVPPLPHGRGSVERKTEPRASASGGKRCFFKLLL